MIYVAYSVMLQLVVAVTHVMWVCECTVKVDVSALAVTATP
jgi:hypothetical protein